MNCLVIWNQRPHAATAQLQTLQHGNVPLTACILYSDGNPVSKTHSGQKLCSWNCQHSLHLYAQLHFCKPDVKSKQKHCKYFKKNPLFRSLLSVHIIITHTCERTRTQLEHYTLHVRADNCLKQTRKIYIIHDFKKTVLLVMYNQSKFSQLWTK